MAVKKRMPTKARGGVPRAERVPKTTQNTSVEINTSAV